MRNRLQLLGLLLLVGCKVGPDYVPPEPELPDVWHQELTKGLSEGTSNLHTWWEIFEDPVLDQLIDRARAGNLDLAVAIARIEESRAVLGISRGDLVPRVDADGTYQRNRLSEETNDFIPPGQSRTDDFFSVGGSLFWEIDLWGRVRRGVESSTAGLEATIEDYRDVLVCLCAEVASAYIDVRVLQERLRIAEANVEAQRGTRELTQSRFDAQIAPELDVRQAELNLHTTESTVPTLRILLGQAIHRLGVLTGDHPQALYETLTVTAALPSVPDSVAIGFPRDLLRQRPDVRRAERQLASQTALIGVATADLYPRFTLLGNLHLEAFESHNVLQSSARAWSFGPSVDWPVFAGGAIKANISAEDARTEQAYHAYEQTVLRALEDVENAALAFVQEQDRREALALSVTAAERSVALVQTLYRTGLTDFQNVLDSERSLFQQQDQLAESDGLVRQNLIVLYKALGGGWAPPMEPGDEELVEPEYAETPPNPDDAGDDDDDASGGDDDASADSGDTGDDDRAAGDAGDDDGK